MSLLLASLLLVNIETDRIVEYEKLRMRNTDYYVALKQAQTQRLPIIVWVGLDDPWDEYQKLDLKAIHVFVNNFQGLNKGVAVGVPSGTTYYRYDLTRDYAAGINKLLQPSTTRFGNAVPH